MSQWTAPSGHKPCWRGCGLPDLDEPAWCSRRTPPPLLGFHRFPRRRVETSYRTSLCPIPLQREVCTLRAKVGMQRKQCQASPSLEYRPEDPVPVGRREPLTNIPSLVNPRSFRQRKDPVPGCTEVQGRMAHTCVAALFACPPESERFQETQSWSG